MSRDEASNGVDLPYAIPADDDVESSTRPEPPRFLTTIAVLSLVLAGMGILSALGGVVGSIVAPMWQDSLIERMEDSENPSAKMQVEIQSTTRQVTRKYQTANIVVMILSLVACVALLVSAILVLRRSAVARTAFLYACIAVAVTDIGKSTIQGLSQSESMRVMGEVLPQAISENAPDRAPGNAEDNAPDNAEANADANAEDNREAEHLVASLFNIARVVILILVVGWCLAKLAFYLFAIQQMRLPKTATYFREVGRAET